MKLQKLHIKNYKSLVDLKIVEPNPFTVFAGPNGAGKSNIFEALEFFNSSIIYTDVASRLTPERLEDISVINITSDLIKIIEKEFGGHNEFLSRSSYIKEVELISSYIENIHSSVVIDYSKKPIYFFANLPKNPFSDNLSIYEQFYINFSRIFIRNEDADRLHIFKSNDISSRLFTSGSNLEEVLKSLLDDKIQREEIFEYLQLFIPGFEKLEIHTDKVSKANTLRIYEKGTSEPFTKKLISDGTYNILCLLTVVFQSNEPQFLCIEEPENGLNPYVVKGMVDLFRNVCEDKQRGHYIWLNTHSQTLVEMLRPEELILVNKENGETKITQPKNIDLHGLPTDEAWLSGALGGGVPW